MWVNFKELRAKLDFEQILRHYGVEVKRKGNQHLGFCPLPNHKGNRNSPSFSANLEKGIFQCFGCGGKGNILEFAGFMENVDIRDGSALRKVALSLQERFCPQGDKSSTTCEVPAAKARSKEVASASPIIVNPVLDFELKGLDAKHPYLLGRGLRPETISYFELGFCGRGLLKDRVAIPLRNQKGSLIGYAGRVVDDSCISEDNPRYRFPSKREREGKRIEFRKTLFLYNGFRFSEILDDLIVVEGFPSVWWLQQNGLQNVVGTMGADCSSKQAELIVSLVSKSGRVWIIPDGDEAGTRFAQSLLTQVSPHRFMRWVQLDAGKQPTDYSGEHFRDWIGKDGLT